MIEKLKQVFFWLAALPAVALSGLARVLFSQRALALWFLAVAAIFCAGPWLRPPLSPDIRGFHIPINFTPHDVTADHVLPTPRERELLSVGVACFAVVLVGTLLVMIRPRWTGLVAGVLFAVAIAANAATMFNHPKLIERMDSELVQRGQISTVLRLRSEQTLAGNSSPRTAPLVLPPHDNSPPVPETPTGHLLRGWQYLIYGVWLMLAAFVGTLICCAGSWQRRLAHTAGWAALGMVLAVVVSGARLRAEWDWSDAVALEQEGRLEEARAALNRAVDQFSEFELLERTWLLAGKIDFRRGQNTAQSHYYRIAQLAMNDARGEAVGLLDDLLDSPAGNATAVRDLAGLVYSDLGRKEFTKGLVVSAYDKFRLSAKYAPMRADAPAALGLAMAEMDRARPERVKALIEPLVARLGDRVLRADLEERLAGAFFQAGRLVEAREHYERSMAIFSQPKYVNAPAQEGLLGM
jgi:hypothetical protein